MKMNGKIRKNCTAVALSFTMAIILLMPAAKASAANTQTYWVSGVYHQTEARTMLNMINDFRTGPDAWQWNSSNTNKDQITGLGELQYDYNLEKIAMLRAMELVVAYDHTRPNGERCFTAYTGGYGAKGENIAIGTSSMTAAYAFELWQETEEPYSGQGHRRNMLSRNFGAVGIAHVSYKGCHYWVQEFADTPVDTAPSPANDSETTVPVEISTQSITSSSYSAAPDSYQLTVEEHASLPSLQLELRTSDTWSYAPAAAATIENPTWTVQDTAIAYIDGDDLVALQSGTTALVATISGQTVKVPINVQKTESDVSAAKITLSPKSFTYSGTACEPSVTVSLSGKKLVQGTDYTVNYSQNIDAGKAQVEINGIGKYTGTANCEFTIKKAANQLTVNKSAYTLKYSKKAQKLTLSAQAASGKISYSSDNSSVKVSRTGKVTIAKKFIGQAVITVKATDKNYKTTTQKITITVTR